MHVVIFEVQPKPGREKDYLAVAQQLRAELEQIDGFISVERFASLYNEGKILSLSFWRDRGRGQALARAQPAPRGAAARARRHFRRLPDPRRRCRARLRHDAARAGA